MMCWRGVIYSYFPKELLKTEQIHNQGGKYVQLHKWDDNNKINIQNKYWLNDAIQKHVLFISSVARHQWTNHKLKRTEITDKLICPFSHTFLLCFLVLFTFRFVFLLVAIFHSAIIPSRFQAFPVIIYPRLITHSKRTFIYHSLRSYFCVWPYEWVLNIPL